MAWMPEPPVDEPVVSEPVEYPAPKLFRPVMDYTLAQWKEYCEEWEECPNNNRCAFYKICAQWPFEWTEI